MELEYGQSIVFFRWSGSDEEDEVTGRDRLNSKMMAPSRSCYPSTPVTTPSSRRAASEFFNSLDAVRLG
jgi:hypothetical protein